MDVIWTFKPIGWTPKDCITHLKENPDMKNNKLSFAGRLDPMAYGLLPIIVNDTKNQKQMELRDSYKTYQFKFIPGLQSDTYDILGLVNKLNKFDGIKNIDIDAIKNIKKQNYPAYSSHCIFDEYYKKKVPLWKLAKENRLPDILPERNVDIKDIQILNTKLIKKDELLNNVFERINKLTNKSGFRNDTILKCWQNLDLDKEYKIYHLESTVSSGTYIRSIANTLGGIAYDIFRIKVKDKYLENTENYDPFQFKIL